MRSLKFILTGAFFGIVLSKAEVISWYRIFEMFHFSSFHMYGVIGSAVLLGVLFVQLIERRSMKDLYGKRIVLQPKETGVAKLLIGGSIFGMGWALVGACPGPLFILLGQGYWSILPVIFGALLGTFLYGLLKNRLPQ